MQTSRVGSPRASDTKKCPKFARFSVGDGFIRFTGFWKARHKKGFGFPKPFYSSNPTDYLIEALMVVNLVLS
ncbi:MAG: hypothetical protein ACRCTX_08375, partial [Afipia sp.]